ncbi:hypothetical protein [Achromobacter xylosoxidans]|uniref:hypothetical protein n=1 Tax=Alcaligenes xylosoxydans xylosoxydans TaxID=85698 RepID=UPI003F75E924
MAEIGVDHELVQFKQLAEAVKHNFERHSVTLLMWDLDADVPVKMGSATCIELRGVRYLLTAAHVLMDCDWELRNPRAIGVVFREDGAANNAFVSRILAVGGKPQDSLDIALLELSAEGADEIASAKEFLPEMRVLEGGSADQSRLFAVFGAPKDWSPGSRVKRTFTAGPMCYVTVSCAPFPSHLDPSQDIALEYEKSSNISPSQEGTVEAPDPHGVSGGGIWLISQSQEGVLWDPNGSKLIGVQSRWNEKDGYVRGTQVQCAFALLDGAGPAEVCANL